MLTGTLLLGLVPVLLLGLAGGALLVGGGRRLRRGRLLAAGLRGGGGLTLLGASLVAGLVASSLTAYQRLIYERPVAKVRIERLAGTEVHLVHLGLLGPRGETVSSLSLPLAGDEWQLDARVLKWRGWANLLGLDARFRLERLSGRYADIERERRGPRTVHSLREPETLDLWQIARSHSAWVPMVDAQYGSSVYLPLRDRAEYRVALTQSGLAARPANAVAEETVKGWR